MENRGTQGAVPSAVCSTKSSSWTAWPETGHRAPSCPRRWEGEGPSSAGSLSAYLGTSCPEGPCFPSSCGNALYVPLKSFAAYSSGHNIHICEAYQLQKTQLSLRLQLNIGLLGNGNACNTIITKKGKKNIKIYSLRAVTIMDWVKMSEF